MMDAFRPRSPGRRLALAGAMLLLSPPLWAGDLFVVVKETAIRSDRKFFAPTQGVAHFQDRLEALEEASGWFRVRLGKTTGWVHGSAVSGSPRTKGGSDTLSGVSSALGTLSGSGGTGQGYTPDEVALAGKGFNPDVEQNYRSRNPQAQFAAVDRMEERQVSRKELMRFVETGHLAQRDGPPTASSGAAAPADPGTPQAGDQGGTGMGSIFDGVKEGAGKIFGGSGKPREEKPAWEN